MELAAASAVGLAATAGMLARVDGDDDDGSVVVAAAAAADGRLLLARPTQLCSCLS